MLRSSAKPTRTRGNMNNQEIANFIRQEYGRLDYLLLTLVSCALIMDKAVDETDANSLQIVKETLNMLREDLSEEETITVATLMAEIEHLGAIDKPDET